MSAFCLHISNETFTIEKILSWNGEHADTYTAETLSYCRQWLQGKEQFELKTSGSTGVPKTIVLQRSQIEASTLSTLHFFNLKAGDAVCCPLSIHVIGGQMMLYRSIIGRLDLYVIPPTKNLESLDSGVTYAFMPIAALQLYEVLTNHSEKIQILNKLTHLLIGGSILTDALLARIRSSITCNVWQSYGMTETVSHIAMRSLHPITDDAYSVLEHINVRVDSRSCLKIKGPVTQQKWIQTNDCVTLSDNKHFIFLGRADFTVNSGGIKIQVEPIEKIIGSLFEQLNIKSLFFVGGVADNALGEKMILAVDTNELDPEKQHFILKKLSELLPRYHVPKAFHTIPFELTASGKIDRKKTLEKIRE